MQLRALSLEHRLVLGQEFHLTHLGEALDRLQTLNQHLQFGLEQLGLLDQLDEVMLLVDGVPLDALEDGRVDHPLTSGDVE